jgi:AcrR family transcriptional regulator
MAEKTAPRARGSRAQTTAARTRAAADAPPARTRQTADERREALVSAAVEHFAQTGLHGTAVSAITDEVGITQPYAFSLFGTKKGLFLAAVERGCDRIAETFRAAAANAGDEGPLAAMGEAYGELMADRSLLLMQLQGYAACGDEEVRDVVRRGYARLYDLVRELSGADATELQGFFATGMLINVAAAMDLPQLFSDDTWMKTCLGEPVAEQR